MSFYKPALKARREQRKLAREGRYSSAYWEGYWNDDETNPYAPNTLDSAEWDQGYNDRIKEG